MFIKIGDIVQVAVPQPINSGLLTYEVSEELQIGSFVEVPISTRRSVGVVWSVGSTNLNRK